MSEAIDRRKTQHQTLMTDPSKTVGRSYELLALLDLCAITADSKDQGGSLGMVLELARRLASGLHDKWEMLEGREDKPQLAAL
jgi:hypothetical protein